MFELKINDHLLFILASSYWLDTYADRQIDILRRDKHSYRQTDKQKAADDK